MKPWHLNLLIIALALLTYLLLVYLREWRPQSRVKVGSNLALNSCDRGLHPMGWVPTREQLGGRGDE